MLNCLMIVLSSWYLMHFFYPIYSLSLVNAIEINYAVLPIQSKCDKIKHYILNGFQVRGIESSSEEDIFSPTKQSCIDKCLYEKKIFACPSQFLLAELKFKHFNANKNINGGKSLIFEFDY